MLVSYTPIPHQLLRERFSYVPHFFASWASMNVNEGHISKRSWNARISWQFTVCTTGANFQIDLCKSQFSLGLALYVGRLVKPWNPFQKEIEHDYWRRQAGKIKVITFLDAVKYVEDTKMAHSLPGLSGKVCSVAVGQSTSTLNIEARGGGASVATFIECESPSCLEPEAIELSV